MHSDNVEFKHISGAIPELVLFNMHEEVYQLKKYIIMYIII